MFVFSFLTFLFKYSRCIFLLLGIEMVFFGLIVYYSFFFESFCFFYFLCFGVVSSVVGLLIFFLCLKGFGFDKVMFYFLGY
uniref:NADH dehydrogenase subunit 4L n=1 Tax=Mastophorus muris TaxID=1499391 RepID=UPI002E77FCDE|nr:NADH dehydrogenase subunit 4L [Mastophorus muris]WPN85868.1 NADH dehydrogenase subunit 4L [Mastophorus muris]